jgi:hypothetical protein
VFAYGLRSCVDPDPVVSCLTLIYDQCLDVKSRIEVNLESELVWINDALLSLDESRSFIDKLGFQPYIDPVNGLAYIDILGKIVPVFITDPS